MRNTSSLTGHDQISPSRKRPKRDHGGSINLLTTKSAEGRLESGAGSSQSDAAEASQRDPSEAGSGSASFHRASPPSASQLPAQYSRVGALQRPVHPTTTRSAPQRLPSSRMPMMFTDFPHNNAVQEAPPSAFGSSFTGDDLRDDLSAIDNPRQWGFLHHGRRLSPSSPENGLSTSPPGVQAPLSAVTSGSDSMETTSCMSPSGPWTDERGRNGSPAQLIQVAEALEEQASSLRLLASQRQNYDPNLQIPLIPTQTLTPSAEFLHGGYDITGAVPTNDLCVAGDGISVATLDNIPSLSSPGLIPRNPVPDRSLGVLSPGWHSKKWLQQDEPQYQDFAEMRQSATWMGLRCGEALHNYA
ncbi:hypothetical protein LTR53_010882 [Teratosphaeriaceae sp. CCFEE 6253]|nr:hypothetical protein LTR53_010882 [Teratosphaeriaceae sp. CCFEE 6253]